MIFKLGPKILTLGIETHETNIDVGPKFVPITLGPGPVMTWTSLENQSENSVFTNQSDCEKFEIDPTL